MFPVCAPPAPPLGASPFVRLSGLFCAPVVRHPTPHTTLLTQPTRPSRHGSSVTPDLQAPRAGRVWGVWVPSLPSSGAGSSLSSPDHLGANEPQALLVFKWLLRAGLESVSPASASGGALTGSRAPALRMCVRAGAGATTAWEGCLEEVALGRPGRRPAPLGHVSDVGGRVGSCPPPRAFAAESRAQGEPPLHGVALGSSPDQDPPPPLPEPFGLCLPCLWPLLGQDPVWTLHPLKEPKG